MKYPRATMRVGGSPMITVKIDYHLSLDDVAGILAYAVDEPDEMPQTKSEAWKKIRDHLRIHSLNCGLWDHTTDALGEVALERARGFFPSLERK